MKKVIILLTALGVLASAPFMAQAGPKEDLKTFRAYFKKKFPNIKRADYANGIYAMDANLRAEWEQIMEFPPYELRLAEGEKVFNTPFKNGKTFASCFKNGGKGIAQNYPYWNKKQGKVKTLEAEILACAKKNGVNVKSKKWKTKKGSSLIGVSAHIHNMARGKKTNVVVPRGDKGALAAYNKGKQFYFARRGQLNFSCAHCHFEGAGKKVRGNLLSMAVGQSTHWPAYRSKWGRMGTMHRRFTGCNKQVRAKPMKAQGPEYTALQYFHTHMSNGIALNAPGTRF